MGAWFRRWWLRRKIRTLLPKLTEEELRYFHDTIRACTSREWQELNRLALVRQEAQTLPIQIHPTPKMGFEIVDDEHATPTWRPPGIKPKDWKD